MLNLKAVSPFFLLQFFFVLLFLCISLITRFVKLKSSFTIFETLWQISYYVCSQSLSLRIYVGTFKVLDVPNIPTLIMANSLSKNRQAFNPEWGLSRNLRAQRTEYLSETNKFTISPFHFGWQNFRLWVSTVKRQNFKNLSNVFFCSNS